MSRYYIGLGTTIHDPALAIVNDEGCVVFAEAAERYLQNKRAWNNVPDDLLRIRDLINEHCNGVEELVLATSWHRVRNAFQLINRFFYLPLIKLFASKEAYRAICTIVHGIYATNYVAGNNVELQCYFENSNIKIFKKQYNHHLSHAAAASYSSPFEEAVCVIVDGFGDKFVTTAVYQYRNGNITRVPGIKPSPRLASLGLFYAYLCNLCGFDALKGEEWKVMGLASYGKLNQKLYDAMRSLIKVKNCRFVIDPFSRRAMSDIKRSKRVPGEGALSSADLAYTGQLVFCDLMTELLNEVYQLNISKNLVLGGGCALNSAFNGMILEKTSFSNVHVFSAPADDGTAMGTALLAYYDDHHSKPDSPEIQSPYLGSRMSNLALDNLMTYGNLTIGARGEEEVCERAAKLLAACKIIGWVQGKAEFGPRALGNRSILADPRSPSIKDRLNSSVKYREQFRPFAPSILHEYGSDYFENYQESPYMERTLRFHKGVVDRVPGVVHVDGTGRLQTVKREWNEKYYDLIEAFRKITGVPLVLNTSFNIMGKPIIHSVEDAISVFFTSGMDALVIEDYLFEKSHV